MILDHDGPCIVIDKPGGLLTQSPPGIDSAEMRVREYLRRKEELTGNFYLGVPHRLDRPVSGVMVFARHARAAKRLSQQFERREVKKVYWALVAGTVEPTEGIWEDYLMKLPNQAHVNVVSSDTDGAQFARLRYRMMQQTTSFCWLQIELETGRTHQIRVQAARRGHAVLGDHQYGSQQTFGPSVADPRECWIALHSRQMNFRHPMEDRQVDVTAPLPEHWSKLSELDFHDHDPGRFGVRV